MDNKSIPQWIRLLLKVILQDVSSSRNISGIPIILSISMVLFILGLFGLLIINTQKVTDYLKENVLVILYFDIDLDDAAVSPLLSEINAMPSVKSATFVSKNEAAFQYKEVLEKDFVEILGDNPLPASIEVYLNGDMPDKERTLAINTLKKKNGVSEVDFQRDLVSDIEKNKRIIGNILIAMSLLLIAVSLVLINNAIRLSVYSKRFLVKSMQLVGATEWFIIKPFVIKSVFHVLIAGILAMVLTVITYFGVGNWIQSNLLGSSINLVSLNIFQADIKIYSLLFASIIGVGLLIVIPGTYFATMRYLRLKVDDLY